MQNETYFNDDYVCSDGDFVIWVRTEQGTEVYVSAERSGNGNESILCCHLKKKLYLCNRKKKKETSKI